MHGLYHKLSQYFHHSSHPKMSDKPDGKTTPTEGNNNAGGKLSRRKLSFMNPFTSRQNSETIQSPTSDSSSTSSITPSKIDSPKQRKSLSHKESIGSASDMEDDVLHEFTTHVQYLGKIELRNPGLTDMMDTVSSTYTRAKPYLKNMEKSTLTFNQEGIHIKHEPNTTTTRSNSSVNSVPSSDHFSLCNPETETCYKPRRILYCAVDKTHQKVFFFNYQYGSRAENIHLHVIVCKTHKDAKELAKRCSQLFKKIQLELHKKDKEKREDHIQGVRKIRTRSNQNITNSTTSSNTGGSKEGSCSGTFGSAGEWTQERVEISIA